MKAMMSYLHFPSTDIPVGAKLDGSGTLRLESKFTQAPARHATARAGMASGGSEAADSCGPRKGNLPAEMMAPCPIKSLRGHRLTSVACRPDPKGNLT